MVVNPLNIASPAPTSVTTAGLEFPAGNTSPPGGNEPPAPPPIDTTGSIEHLDRFISDNARGLRFSVDPGSGDMVVTVVNPNNGQVIRQIPSEEMLRIATALRQYMDLHLVDDEA